MFYVIFVSLKTWNTPGMEGDSAHSCYLDKVEGGRSTVVLSFKSVTKKNFNGLFQRRKCDAVLS